MLVVIVAIWTFDTGGEENKWFKCWIAASVNKYVHSVSIEWSFDHSVVAYQVTFLPCSLSIPF